MGGWGREDVCLCVWACVDEGWGVGGLPGDISPPTDQHYDSSEGGLELQKCLQRPTSAHKDAQRLSAVCCVSIGSIHAWKAHFLQ